MVTGVETAGLVLGAFPVAIECIRVYMKGASRIKKMIQYKVILEVFLQDLETEKCIFQDLCEDLLEPYCEADEIKELIKDPGGTSWSAEAIKDILQHHLTPQSIPIFLTVMKRLDDNLGMLAVRFQPQPPDFTTNQSLDFDDKATCSKICVQLARAWKTGMLLEYRDEKMRCIRLLNANLQKLLRKSIHEGGSRGNKSRPTPIASLKAIETFNSTRKQAQAAFSILKGHVLNMCNCNGASHSISLQLEQHMILSKKPGGQQGNKSSQTFTVMLSKENNGEPGNWREIQLEAVELGPQDATVGKKRKIQFTEPHNDDKDNGCTASSKQHKFHLSSTAAQDQRRSILKPKPYSIASGILPKPALLAPKLDSTMGNLSLGKNGPKPAPRLPEKLFQKSIGLYGQGALIHATTIATSSRPPGPIIIKPTSECRRSLIYGESVSSSSKVQKPETIEIQPQDELQSANPPQPTDHTLITSLCATVLSHIHAIRTCLGILKSPINHERLSEKFFVWTPTLRTLCMHPAGVTSLYDLLGVRSSQGRIPSLQSRLALATKLASSLMQLHDSEWLPEDWSSKNIFFPNSQLCSHESALARPLVRNTPRSPESDDLQPRQTAAHAKLWNLIRANPNLVSLGIVLIELVHWEKLEALKERFNITSNMGPDALMNQYTTAIFLMETISEVHSSEEFRSVVKRCITGLDHLERSLNVNAFKIEVYRSVVQPLEQDLVSAGWTSVS